MVEYCQKREPLKFTWEEELEREKVAEKHRGWMSSDILSSPQLVCSKACTGVLGGCEEEETQSWPSADLQRGAKRIKDRVRRNRRDDIFGGPSLFKMFNKQYGVGHEQSEQMPGGNEQYGIYALCPSLTQHGLRKHGPVLTTSFFPA